PLSPSRHRPRPGEEDPMTRRKRMLSAERLEDRLVPAGALDTTFNPTGSTPGLQTVNFGSIDFATATVVQPDGKIVVAGSQDDSSANFAVARLNLDGTLDTSFNGTGKQTVSFTAID